MKKRLRAVSILLAALLGASQLGGCSAEEKNALADSSMDKETQNYVAMAQNSEECILTDGAGPGSAEEYNERTENEFIQTERQPLSTFSADVDTASYSIVRRMLNQGQGPSDIPSGAVRLEELLNYFHYDYEAPRDGQVFGISIDGTDCPWQPEHGLVRIGIRTEAIDFSKSPRSNLVFLLDVSGSMYSPDKLPLLKQAFGMLVDNLDEKDRVSIVTYAGSDQIVLDGARGNEKGRIMDALNSLEAGGGTYGSAGIRTAYELAERNFILYGNNLIILATDGDLNIGETSQDELKALVEEKRNGGVYLSVLGFGSGNLKDDRLETLADYGNGNYAYIDSLMEAKKVLVDELGSTLVTVAEDVKFQVEFNASYIKEYRLLGYENRLLAAEDFTDDTKDAREVGAGHTVTVLYEVVWADGAAGGTSGGQAGENAGGTSGGQAGENAGGTSESQAGAGTGDWAALRIRYKEPGASESREMTRAIGADCYQSNVSAANMLLEASVAEFGLLLSGSQYLGNSSYAHILSMWEGAAQADQEEIAEFLELVRLAESRVATPGE